VATCKLFLACLCVPQMASKSLADETRLLAEIPPADPVALDMYGLDHSILQNFDEDHPFVHMDIDNDLHNFDDVVGNIDDITKFIQRTASIPDDVGGSTYPPIDALALTSTRDPSNLTHRACNAWHFLFLPLP
jgi:hypothetical protein